MELSVYPLAWHGWMYAESFVLRPICRLGQDVALRTRRIHAPNFKEMHRPLSLVDSILVLTITPPTSDAVPQPNKVKILLLVGLVNSSLQSHWLTNTKQPKNQRFNRSICGEDDDSVTDTESDCQSVTG